MKIVYFLCSLCALCITAYAQYWEWQNPLPQGYSLYDIQFVNSSVGYAVGVCGTVIKTTDGGNTWFGRDCPTSLRLERFFFINETHGWACGCDWSIPEQAWIFGTLFHTSDGGDTWIQQAELLSGTFEDVTFTDTLNGWIVGENYGDGIMLHTSNGGSVWNIVTTDSLMPLRGIYFRDPLRGWAVGTGRALKTFDGGIVWSLSQDTSLIGLNYITFIDSLYGWAGGCHSKLLKTTDGGETWTRISLDSSNLCFQEITFVDRWTGFAVFASNPNIYVTHDGGNTWMPRTAAANMSGIAIANENNWWAVGYYGMITHSQNAGESWALSSGIHYYVDIWSRWDISVLDSQKSWISGPAGIVLETTNGGRSWDSTTAPASLHSLQMLDENNGWAVEYGGRNVLRTTDGGQTWSIVHSFSDYSNIDLYCASFVDIQRGVVAGGYWNSIWDEGGDFYAVTLNGGERWNEQYEPDFVSYGVVDVEFTDSNYVWSLNVIGDVYWSNNDFTNWYWNHLPESWPWPGDITAQGTSTCWIVGEGNAGPAGFWVTHDRGLTWSTISNDAFFSVAFTGNYGIALGSTKTLYTTDCGITWIEYRQNLDLDFRDSHLGVASNGEAWYTEHGGNIRHFRPPIHSSTGVYTAFPSSFSFTVYPNPANPAATISFEIPDTRRTIIRVFDLTGRLVQTLADRRFDTGLHDVRFDGSGLPSGIYFVRMEAGSFAKTQKIVLLK